MSDRKTLKTSGMQSGIFTAWLVLAGMTTFFSACIIRDSPGYNYNVSGHIIDEEKNPMNYVRVLYNCEAISTKTDAGGTYTINKPKALFIKFEKEGYQSVKTTINDYSDLGHYKFKPIQLQQSTDTMISDKDFLFSKDEHTPDQVDFTGNVEDIFGKPIDDVLITLTDDSNFTQTYDGVFHFDRRSYRLNFEKNGYEKLSIEIQENKYETYTHNNIILVKKANRKGVYLVQSGEFLPLPLAKLDYETEEKFGTSLWGGRYGYNIREFYYPDKIKAFKINKENKSKLRFVIYDKTYASLYAAQSPTGHLCSANYRRSSSPATKGDNRAEKIYPKEYNRTDTGCIIVEFVKDTIERNYVFVSSKTKKGYHFTY